MPVSIAQVSVANGHNWQYLIDRVNENSNAMSTVVLTTGSTATGNSAITGTFTANVSLANTATFTTLNANTVTINSNTGFTVPKGTTAQRPSANGFNGIIRYNSDLNAYEGSSGNTWITIAQLNANNSIFSTILTPTINFESTANNSLYYSANTLYAKLSNSVVVTVNSSVTSISGTLKVSNATQSIIIAPPSAAAIANGNYYLNANGSYSLVVSQPAGSNTQVQFNDSGSFAASAGITFNKTSNTLYVANTVNALTFTGQANTVANISNTQIITALGGSVAYANGTNATGTWGISVSGNAGSVTNGVYTTGTYANPSWLTSISGTIVSGNISGNAGSVTNGVYTTGTYANPSWLTSLDGSKISGNISGSANNITAYTVNQNLGTTNAVTFSGITNNSTLNQNGSLAFQSNGNWITWPYGPAIYQDTSGNGPGDIVLRTYNGTTYYYTTIAKNGDFLVANNLKVTGGVAYNLIYLQDTSNVNRIAFTNSSSSSYYRTGSANSGWQHQFQNYADTTKWLMGGSSTDASFYCAGNIVAYWSDQRLKELVERVDSYTGLQRVLSYEVVTFQWNEKGREFNGKKEGEREQGLIAQDVQKINPEAVVKNHLRKDENDEPYLTIDRSNLIYDLIGAIQEQQKMIEELRNKIHLLESK